VNRLQDLNYRVQTLSDPAPMAAAAAEAKPMLVFMDLEASGKDVFGAVKQLRRNQRTSHIPVVGFTMEAQKELEETARAAGVTVVVTEAVLLNHLPQVLEQALQVE